MEACNHGPFRLGKFNPYQPSWPTELFCRACGEVVEISLDVRHELNKLLHQGHLKRFDARCRQIVINGGEM